MAFLIKMSSGSQIGFYDCLCGKGAAIVSVVQKNWEPPTEFVIKLVHKDEDGEESEHSVCLSVAEFSSLIMDVSEAFYGSKN